MSNKKISYKDIANEDVNFIEEIIKEYKSFGDLHNPDFEDAEKIYKALENILAERKQDKKRIQELEKENKTLKGFTSEVFNSEEEKDITQVTNKSFKEFMNDYISKQKVKEIIKNETIDISGFECIALEDLQELLEGE